jgi:predicted metal-dependent hydrolase
LGAQRITFAGAMLYAPFRNSSRTPLAERLLVGGNERHYEIAAIRHPRARRYTLRVRHASRDVVLTMPRRGNLRDARAFAERNVDWIASKIAAIPAHVPFADGESIPVCGIPHRISHRPGERGTVWIENDANGDALICVAGAGAHIARRVADFLKSEARKALSTTSRAYAAKIGVTIGRIGLRDSTTRWGSCSEDGSLSYSWRLIFAPAYVLDYLAAHEIAHRIELNHSDRFWALLDSMTPERHRAEAWLAAHGNGLHRYGSR